MKFPFRNGHLAGANARVAGETRGGRAVQNEENSNVGTMVSLTAGDGHQLGAYRAEPAGASGPGLVVIQEIFGVNGHIRGVADGYAADGFTALAPALFDRVSPGIELGYEDADVTEGREIRAKVELDQALADVTAAVRALADEGRQVGVIGYCWGGSLAWAAATRIDGVACSVSYYGGNVPDMADEQPKCPILVHFGETDHSIPMDRVEAFRAAQPDLPVHIYPAGHGFNCEQRGSYHAESAATARERSLAFLKEHLG